MENENQLSGKELYELKRQEKLKTEERGAKKQNIGRILKIAIPFLVIMGGLGMSVWYSASLSPIPQEEIISKKGIHWHPHLTIFVKDQKQEIPANLGLGAVHDPIHTHDMSGVLHLEIKGLVQRDDTKLSRFFKVWNKDLTSFGPSVKMFVNGKENNELGNHQMKDGDQIELKYNLNNHASTKFN